MSPSDDGQPAETPYEEEQKEEEEEEPEEPGPELEAPLEDVSDEPVESGITHTLATQGCPHSKQQLHVYHSLSCLIWLCICWY